MKSKKDIKTLLKIFLFVLVVSGCKKFVEIPPPLTQLTSSNVFNIDASAMAAQSAIYAAMASNSDNFTCLNQYADLSSDELTNYSAALPDIQLYQNGLIADNGDTYNLWNTGYKYIYQANAVLEGVTGSSTLSSDVKNQLIGEAKFIRAYWHFYLVNLFGDVPLILSTNYLVNNTITRTPITAVYQAIISDLKDAQSKLNPNFVEADGITSTVSTERLRPTKFAADALLARVYLFIRDWPDAEIASTSVINNPAFSLLGSLDSVFLTNSMEAIWQIGVSTANTNEAYYFILSVAPQGSGVSISPQLLNAFEPGDARRIHWIDSIGFGGITYYYPFKYKNLNPPPVTEYEVVLRLSEQYLIRAEAEAENGDSLDAINDLNKIRNRALLPNYSTLTQGSLLSAILHERQVELFTEFGHRWMDLKRTGNIDAVMNLVTPLKGGNGWNTYQQLYPIPQAEIIINPKLTQNTGY
jgi:starch-binding outer membrane protein, SusD/RagB family